ncbi:plus-3-domain-containing protein [Meredithblackwellia eburnea MCA 4105]
MDIDDDLLALAEGTSSSKRKSSKSTSDDDAPPPSKRQTKKQQQPDSDDDDDDDSDDDHAYSKYPLEGKFIDEQDRARILAMPELDRENILGERADELNQAATRRSLRRMVRAKERAEGVYADDDGGAGRRERKATGSTREKREGLEKLKKRREEKGKQKDRTYDDEPSPQRRRASPGAYSDSEYEEEGEIDSQDRKPVSTVRAGGRNKREADTVGPEALQTIMVTRAKLAEFCNAPWFESWVKGAWVRYLVGSDTNNIPQYRLCQVERVQDVPDDSYTFEGTKTTVRLILRHASAVREFKMDAVSNSAFETKEFIRLAKTLENDKMSLPSMNEAEKLKTALSKRSEYIMTEADLAQQLAKKNKVNPAQGKARLLIQRDFFRQSGDLDRVNEINAQLALLEAPAPADGHETESDRMRKLNERNRATNREEIKKAEARGQDERRRQAEALARGDADVKVDASARVKTLTRLTYDR